MNKDNTEIIYIDIKDIQNIEFDIPNDVVKKTKKYPHPPHSQVVGCQECVNDSLQELGDFIEAAETFNVEIDETILKDTMIEILSRSKRTKQFIKYLK